MSNVEEAIIVRDKKYDFKLITILTFILVAISFFSVGFIYAGAPQMSLLIKLIVIFGGINSFLVFYLIKKIDGATTTQQVA